MTFNNWQKYKKYKTLVQKFCRQSHDDDIKDLITEGRDNHGHSSKRFWSYIKSKHKERSGIGDLFDRGEWITNNTRKANLFNSQFSKFLSSPGAPFRPPPAEPTRSASSLQNIQISEKGILKLLLNINENNAPRPDGIPGKLVKMCVEWLCCVFQVFSRNP